jgi:hypothetical protein
MRVASVLRSDAQILFQKSKVNHNYTELLYETRYLLHRASDAYELTQSPGSMPSRLISDVTYSIMKDPIILDNYCNFIGDTKVPHEGIVIKNIDGNRHKVAKVINPDYLIYGEKHNIGDSH